MRCCRAPHGAEGPGFKAPYHRGLCIEAGLGRCIPWKARSFYSACVLGIMGSSTT